MQENKKEQTTGTKTPKLGQESGFQAYRLYNAKIVVPVGMSFEMFQSSFELTGYITITVMLQSYLIFSFKALSSLQVI